MEKYLLQPAPGLANYKLGQKTIISEHYAQIDQAPIYIVHDMTVLNERYLVEHKLGHGGGSTVWMAHDLQDKKDVALKVIALGEWSDNEAYMQDKIVP